MRSEFAVFFVLLFSALTGLNYFVHRRLSNALGLGRGARIALTVLLVSAMMAMVVGRLLRPIGPSAARMLGAYGALVELAVIVACAPLAIERLVAGVVALVARLRTRHGVNDAASSTTAVATEDVARAEVATPAPQVAVAATASERLFGRRGFISASAAGGALCFGGGTSLYAAVFGRHDYTIEEVPILLPTLPRALDGFTIVQLSDIHFGTFVGEPELRSAVELVARARPDVIALTGDLIDHDARFAPLLGELVRRLSSHARVVAVPGNHDHYAGIAATLDALKRGGAEVLMNRTLRMGDRAAEVALVGVDDVWALRKGGGPRLAQALEGVPDDMARVLLCHNPVFFPEATPHVHLQISGHTHGGQFNPGVRPADLVLPHGYVAGHYRRGESQLYINRGFGTAGPPARLGASPEVTKLVLHV
jgi:predicted MPP superfamily phosphohydrolase